MRQLLSAFVALSLFLLSGFQFLPLLVERWISWISTFRQWISHNCTIQVGLKYLVDFVGFVDFVDSDFSLASWSDKRVCVWQLKFRLEYKALKRTLTAIQTQGNTCILKSSTEFVTFRVSRRRREMYIGHTRLCVYVSVCPSPHSDTIARTRM